MRLLLALLATAALQAAPAARPELVIDPGHGKGEPGVSVEGGSEAELVFDIAQKLQALLKAKNIESVLSREAGTASPQPSTRAAKANASGAKAMLSLHLNHSPSPAVRGPRIFVPKARSQGGPGQPKPWNLAAGYKAEAAQALGLELARTLQQSESARLNVQALDLASFKGLAIPGVMVELGFLSHAESRARFLDADYRKSTAERLAAGVEAWLKSSQAAAP